VTCWQNLLHLFFTNTVDTIHSTTAAPRLPSRRPRPLRQDTPPQAAAAQPAPAAHPRLSHHAHVPLLMRFPEKVTLHDHYHDYALHTTKSSEEMAGFVVKNLPRKWNYY
jgi:hypothetical protein